MGIQHILKTAKYTDDVVKISDEVLVRIQEQLLNMIKEIAPVLEKRGIDWVLTAGSMLGAVRHKGFIPWDDDLDILMTRENFIAFEKIFDKELSKEYILKRPGDKGYLLHYPQIQKRGTVMQNLQSTEECTDGLFIDVFILENTFDNIYFRLLHGLLCTSLLFIDSTVRMSKCKKTIFKYTDNDPAVKRAINMRARLAFLFCFLPFEEWLKISDKVFSCVKKNSSIGVIPGGAKHFFGELFPKSIFFPSKIVDFNGINVRIPIDPKLYLVKRYGAGYMKMPPVSQREQHIYIRVELPAK